MDGLDIPGAQYFPLLQMPAGMQPRAPSIFGLESGFGQRSANLLENTKHSPLSSHSYEITAMRRLRGTSLVKAHGHFEKRSGLVHRDTLPTILRYLWSYIDIDVPSAIPA